MVFVKWPENEGMFSGLFGGRKLEGRAAACRSVDGAEWLGPPLDREGT